MEQGQESSPDILPDMKDTSLKLDGVIRSTPRKKVRRKYMSQDVSARKRIVKKPTSARGHCEHCGELLKTVHKLKRSSKQLKDEQLSTWGEIDGLHQKIEYFHKCHLSELQLIIKELSMQKKTVLDEEQDAKNSPDAINYISEPELDLKSSPKSKDVTYSLQHRVEQLQVALDLMMAKSHACNDPESFAVVIKDSLTKLQDRQDTNTSDKSLAGSAEPKRERNSEEDLLTKTVQQLQSRVNHLEQQIQENTEAMLTLQLNMQKQQQLHNQELKEMREQFAFISEKCFVATKPLAPYPISSEDDYISPGSGKDTTAFDPHIEKEILLHKQKNETEQSTRSPLSYNSFTPEDEQEIGRSSERKKMELDGSTEPVACRTQSLTEENEEV
uniref:Uncharacterized protein n=1 Tax=Vannella robusta TaxID=1487602 RepID=A0A7S4M739_9EUKA